MTSETPSSASPQGTAPALRGGASFDNGTAPALRGGASFDNGTAPALRGGASFGGWFLLWGMVLLSIWMSPVPADTAVKVTYTRIALALLAAGTAVFAGLQLQRDRARAHATFLRATGTLALAGGIWSANGPWVIPNVPGRAVVLTFAAVCLLAAFCLDLARESRQNA